MYPAHEKLQALNGKNNVIGIFLEWLDEQGYCICKYNDADELFPVRESRTELIGKHFEIDPNELEREKQQMLASIRGG